MPTIYTMKNPKSFVAGGQLCSFQLDRFSIIDRSLRLSIETPCSVCLIPNDTCWGVPHHRIWTVPANPDFTPIPGYESIAEDLNVAHDLVDDSRCTWVSDRQASSDGPFGNITIRFDSTISVTSGSTAETFNATLTIDCYASGAITSTKTINYEANDVSPGDNPVVFEVDGDDFWTIASGVTLSFRESVNIAVRDDEWRP